ncbi:unnamed protein product [Meganyctiphanes norvegica]|uniref:C2H2-type domain-containing protein n=1 Tax=Meganyctiphanes norvegica TaxID=48144 RepID=A0AAV2RDY7_MEGNR
MNEMSSDENDDEFECSECDFKCKSENNIMQHNTIHPYTNDGVLDISRHGKFIKDDPDKNDTVVKLQAKLSSEEEIVSCTKLADSPKNNENKVKTEPISLKVVSTTEVLNENEIGNNIIKLEDIDIKQEDISNVSSCQINDSFNVISKTEVYSGNEIGNNIIWLEDIDIKQEDIPNVSSPQVNYYENIQPDQNLLSLIASKNRNINGRISKHIDFDKNLYIEDDIVDESGSILKQSEPSQSYMV